MQALIYAKAVLIAPNGNVLLLTRSNSDERRPGEVDFPGGRIEEGEEILEGVVREISEETGMTVPKKDLSIVYAATEPYETASVTRLLCVARVKSIEVQLSFEHAAFEWVDLYTVLKEFEYHFYGEGLRYAHDHGLVSV